MTKTYSCPKCKEFDLETNINNKELKHCPKCGEIVTRVFKSPHYSFKTDGFCGRGFA